MGWNHQPVLIRSFYVFLFLGREVILAWNLKKSAQLVFFHEDLRRLDVSAYSWNFLYLVPFQYELYDSVIYKYRYLDIQDEVYHPTTCSPMDTAHCRSSTMLVGIGVGGGAEGMYVNPGCSQLRDAAKVNPESRVLILSKETFFQQKNIL